MQYRTIIENAENVPVGILRAALCEDCNLILMARGRHTGKGSYVDQVLDRSAIPTLVIGR